MWNQNEQMNYLELLSVSQEEKIANLSREYAEINLLLG